MNASHEGRASQSTTSDIQPSEPLSSADTHSSAAFSSPVNISTINNSNPHRAHRASISSCNSPIDPICDAYDDRASKTKNPSSYRATRAAPGVERVDGVSIIQSNNSTNQPTNNRPTLHQDSAYVHIRQQQQYPQYNNHHLSTADYATLPWPSAHVAASNQSAQRLYPSGVDKLILAAMMEDAATTASMTNAHKYSQNAPPRASPAHYLPTGRGIGYLNNARDSQVPTPSNKSELELYRLLERANLLNYFATFLSYGKYSKSPNAVCRSSSVYSKQIYPQNPYPGGDDVQQLSDADEDEFLEIMSLVGMTQKPLHVRRLQKALIEWRENKESSETNFRRPSEIFFTHNGNFNNVDNIYHNNHRQQQHIVNSAVFSESPAPTPTSSSSQSITVVPSDNSSGIGIDQVGSNNRSGQPHDVLVGAPKRPRLMDSLHQQKSSAPKRSTSRSPRPV